MSAPIFRRQGGSRILGYRAGDRSPSTIAIQRAFLRGVATVAIGLAAAPTASIAAADSPPRLSAEAPTRCEALIAGLDAMASAALADGVPGLVVGVAGPEGTAIVRAYGMADLEAGSPMSEASVFRIASLTKSFTAAAILRLAADGRLDLDDRASARMPAYPWLGNITVRQLLAHTSGLSDYAGALDTTAKAQSHTLEEMASRIEHLDGRQAFAPGSAWAYSNSNYVMLGLVIEAVTGRPYTEYLQQEVIARAGLTATTIDDLQAIVPHRVRGYSLGIRTPFTLRNADWIHPSTPGPAGALRSTARDILAWNRALFSGIVIPASDVELMTDPARLNDGRTSRWGMPDAWREGLDADYGLGVFISTSATGRRFWHTGDIDGFASWMGHWPETSVSAVIMTNTDLRNTDAKALEDAVATGSDCISARL